MLADTLDDWAAALVAAFARGGGADRHPPAEFQSAMTDWMTERGYQADFDVGALVWVGVFSRRERPIGAPAWAEAYRLVAAGRLVLCVTPAPAPQPVSFRPRYDVFSDRDAALAFAACCFRHYHDPPRSPPP